MVLDVFGIIVGEAAVAAAAAAGVAVATPNDVVVVAAETDLAKALSLSSLVSLSLLSRSEMLFCSGVVLEALLYD